MLYDVVRGFFPSAVVEEVIPFGNGHINNTFLVSLSGSDAKYILQRINTDVFPDPEGIADTHKRLEEVVFRSSEPFTIAKLVNTASETKLYFDPTGGAWRMTTFISDSYSIEQVKEDWQAYEAGNAFGWFARICQELNPNEFKEPIRNFHRLSFRIRQLNDAIHENRAGRLYLVKDLIQFYKEREAKLCQIEQLADQGKIPARIVHNDTKINNLLFRNNKAVAIIDLDTAGPGLLCFDYGDALRTTANMAAEDEKDLGKVKFNTDFFAAFTLGYIFQVKTILSNQEAKYLYLAPVLMTYIMGVRFLADYLNNDIYYKTNYSDHNLDRSRVQKTLIESMESQEKDMKNIINESITGNR